MGFLESLRQRLVNEQQESQQKAAQEGAQRKATKAAGLQAKVAEKVRQEQRQELAKNFRQESGVGALISKLASILNEEPEIPITGSGYPTEDPDSVVDVFTWDRRWDGKSWNPKFYDPDRDWHPSHGGWRLFTSRSFLVETCPSGTIIFHHGKNYSHSTKIGLQDWRSEKDKIEEGLGKAQEDPMITSQSPGRPIQQGNPPFYGGPSTGMH